VPGLGRGWEGHCEELLDRVEIVWGRVMLWRLRSELIEESELDMRASMFVYTCGRRSSSSVCHHDLPERAFLTQLHVIDSRLPLLCYYYNSI
jgi:hypothetical protein